MYRCIAGRAPFAAGSLPELVHQVVHAAPHDPRVHARVSPEVEAFLAIGLAKRPDDRFQSGVELADAFRAALLGALWPELRTRAARILADLPWTLPR